MAEFHFDFDAVKGLEYDQAFTALFLQLEGWVNSNQPKSLIFGGSAAAAPADPAAPPAPKKITNLDTTTITPKTITMKSFVIRDNAAGDRKMLIGKAMDDTEIDDLILPGYDQEPYGPVVTGEAGRYNLKRTK